MLESSEYHIDNAGNVQINISLISVAIPLIPSHMKGH